MTAPRHRTGKRLYLLMAVALLLLPIKLLLNLRPNPWLDVPVADTSPARELTPPCPWRDPENDLKTFFPGATRYAPEERILSERRLELKRRLGRQPTGEDLLLRLNRVYRDEAPLGSVLTRRVKGQSGAIEIVLLVTEDGPVQGLRLQGLREPAPISAAVQNPEWLGSFKGLSASSDLRLGQEIPDVAPQARPSAEAVVEAVRTLLILMDTSRASNIEHLHRSAQMRRD